MEEGLRILIIGFCIYGIVYCIYAIKIVLIHREVQIRRIKQIERDAVKLNKLYLRLVRKCKETPKEDMNINETMTELKRLKRKAISFC